MPLREVPIMTNDGLKFSSLTQLYFILRLTVQEVCIKPTAKLGTSTFDCRVQSAHSTPPASSFMPDSIPGHHDESAKTTGKSRDRRHRHKRKCSSSNGLGPEDASEYDNKWKGDRLVALACRIDRYSRGVFPLAFAAFNITYWVVFVNVSPQPHDTDFVYVD